MNKAVVLLPCVLFLAACVPQDQYYWGEYEGVVYENLVTPEDADVQKQIERIEGDIVQAAESGKPVPPGEYAELGYLYDKLGYHAKAVDALNKEKALYPEAGHFVNGLKKRAVK